MRVLQTPPSTKNTANIVFHAIPEGRVYGVPTTILSTLDQAQSSVGRVQQLRKGAGGTNQPAAGARASGGGAWGVAVHTAQAPGSDQARR
eukprot:COSAG02_NODE_7070_length_3200_cov_2.047082_6_plen_90_part_00